MNDDDAANGRKRHTDGMEEACKGDRRVEVKGSAAAKGTGVMDELAAKMAKRRGKVDEEEEEDDDDW